MAMPNIIRRPDDLHIHFRTGPEMTDYVRDAAAVFGRTLVMPNTDPPIDTPERLAAYAADIRAAAPVAEFPYYAPLMTFKLTQRTSPRNVTAMRDRGAVAAKLYPEGATTNSADGVTDIETLLPVFRAMAEAEIVLCIHAEDPDAFVLEREAAYLPRVAWIRDRCPDLRIIVEHLSTAEGVRFVRESSPNVAGTITAHHLAMTLDDVLGAGIQPHNYCKPVLKRPQDREALLVAAVSGSPSFFFGSDSAPHPREHKECGVGAAGVYTAPLSMSVLAEIFSRQRPKDWLPVLERFTAETGADFYRIPRNDSRIEIAERPWTVPESCHGVVPMFAGRQLRYAVVGQ